MRSGRIASLRVATRERWKLALMVQDETTAPRPTPTVASVSVVRRGADRRLRTENHAAGPTARLMPGSRTDPPRAPSAGRAASAVATASRPVATIAGPADESTAWVAHAAPRATTVAPSASCAARAPGPGCSGP